MKDYDVLVAGAGASGLCAAVAAARQGKNVLLLEKSSLLGGTNTQCLVGPLMGFHAGNRQVVRGLAQEIVDRLEKRGGTLGHIRDPLGVASTITPIEPEILKQVCFDMVRGEKRITLLLHSFLSAAAVENERIRSVTAVQKGGSSELSAGIYVDATGDADLAYLTGVRCVQGRAADGFSQPMTLVMKIGGVDFSPIRAAMKAHPDQFVLCDDADRIPYIAVSGYFDAVARARERGDLTLPRDRVLLFQGVRPGEAVVNMSRVVRRQGTSAADLTLAEMEGRAQADEILSFLRRDIDGFQSAYLLETGAAIGIRESRHIQGKYTLSERDILEETVFPDSVAMCAFPIDIHDPLGKELHWTKTDTGTCYDVPYRVMLPDRPVNLLVTGRCISATHEAAASVRITPTAMALGEAAGIAAALAGNGNPASVDIPLLQKKILEAGGVPGRQFL